MQLDCWWMDKPLVSCSWMDRPLVMPLFSGCAQASHPELGEPPAALGRLVDGRRVIHQFLSHTHRREHTTYPVSRRVVSATSQLSPMHSNTTEVSPGPTSNTNTPLRCACVPVAALPSALHAPCWTRRSLRSRGRTRHWPPSPTPPSRTGPCPPPDTALDSQHGRHIRLITPHVTVSTEGISGLSHRT